MCLQSVLDFVIHILHALLISKLCNPQNSILLSLLYYDFWQKDDFSIIWLCLGMKNICWLIIYIDIAQRLQVLEFSPQDSRLCLKE